MCPIETLVGVAYSISLRIDISVCFVCDNFRKNRDILQGSYRKLGCDSFVGSVVLVVDCGYFHVYQYSFSL